MSACFLIREKEWGMDLSRWGDWEDMGTFERVETNENIVYENILLI